jgi:dolichyl-diphosphooligosaccharide--protein glycosyltransferase
MDDLRDVTESLLADKPELEGDLRELLAVDADGAWTFADIPLDSGTFGEIVSRDLVEETADGYRLVDREAVRAAIDEDERSDFERSAGTGLTAVSGTERVRSGLPSVDRRAALALVAALACMVTIRAGFGFEGVFRNGDVVLASNDPYAYWRHVEVLRLDSVGVFDLGSLPPAIAEGDVLFVVVLWWSVSLLGAETATVLAWYPVVAAVVGGLLVYLLAVELTSDQRVGVVSVLFLAITPVHAVRTSLGFADHDGFDLLWLLSIALALAVLARQRSDDRTNWTAAAALGVGIAAQTMAWRGAPILLAPLGLYAAIVVLDDVRADRSPLGSSTGLLAGLALGSLVTVAFHFVLGWLPLFRATAPALLWAGAVAITGLAELSNRLGWSTRRFALAEGALGAAGLAVMFAVPPLAGALSGFVTYFQTTGTRNIAETVSIFGPNHGSIAAPIFLFGLLFFLAIPYLGWITFRAYRDSEPGWLVIVVYGWYFLAFAVLQLRFAVVLAPFVALLAGLAFVHATAWLDLARPLSLFGSPGQRPRRRIEIPEAKTTVLVVVLFVFVGGLCLVQAPLSVQELQIEESTSETGRWLEAYTAAQNLTYPEDTVLAKWDRVRVYNYFSTSRWEPWRYSRNYSRMLRSQNPTGWYQRLHPHTGFIVLSSPSNNPRSGTIEAALARPLEEPPTLTTSHYRLVSLRPGPEIAVYRLVEGSRITGTGPAASTLPVQATVTVEGRSFAYQHVARTNETGHYAITVPYEGQYHVGNRTIRCGVSGCVSVD